MKRGIKLEKQFSPVMCEFIDERMYFKTMTDMKLVGDETSNPNGAELFPEHFIAICGDEDGSGLGGQYEFSKNNSFDSVTGKWRNIHKDPKAPTVNITAPFTVAKKINEWDDVAIKYNLNEKGTTKTSTVISATLTPNDAPITKWAIYIGESTTPVKEEILDEDHYIVTPTDISFTYATPINADTTVKVVATDGNAKVGIDIVYLQFNFKKYVFLVKPEVEYTEITQEMIKAATLPSTVEDNLWRGKEYSWKNIETINPDDGVLHLMKTVYAYPKEYGQLTEVLDRNSLSIIHSFDLTNVEVASAVDVSITCDYYVYVLDHGIKCSTPEEVEQNYI